MDIRFKVLNDIACDNIKLVFDELGIRTSNSGRYLYGKCPIHDGNNYTSFTFYPDGEEVRGIWLCHTKKCHLKHGKTLLGLVKAVLGKENRGGEAVDFLLKTLGYKSLDDLPLPSQSEIRRGELAKVALKLNNNKYSSEGWAREAVIRKLEIPSTFYLDRGYAKDILLKYDVGFSRKLHRVIIPVYDNEHKNVVGALQRTVYPKCSKCDFYHAPTFPCPVNPAQQVTMAKWRNTENFEKTRHLFNYWFAKPLINKLNYAIICEGPADVWRLEEAGYHNAVALMGTSLSDNQLTLLQMTGAMKIILMLDGDEAGKTAAGYIVDQLKRIYNVKRIDLNGKDPGEMAVKDLQALLSKY